MGKENELKCLALYCQKVPWKQLYESRLESGLWVRMCTLKSSSPRSTGRSTCTSSRQPWNRVGLHNLQRKNNKLKGIWLTQSQKATGTLRWDSNSSTLHLFFQKIKNKKKKSYFSTEKAKAGRLPGVPGQLELHNEALSQNKQTSTHSPSKKKRQKEKERDREMKKEVPQKPKSFS